MDVPWLKALTGIPLSQVLLLSEYELALNASLEFFECGKYLNQLIISGFLMDGNPLWTRGRKVSNQKHSKIFTARRHTGMVRL